MTWRKTTDHREILNWVSRHGGQPAGVRARDGSLGAVRLEFHKEAINSILQPISWDEFFDQFEERHLAFVYETNDEPSANPSSVKLVNRQGS